MGAPVTAWLIFRARDRKLRTTSRRPRLDWDEVAWRVDLAIPDSWAKIIGTIDLGLPQDSPPTIMIEEAS